jgi:hypothetical protein
VNRRAFRIVPAPPGIGRLLFTRPAWYVRLWRAIWRWC